MVAIQSMELSGSPKVKEKSSEVINSIQALLGEFDPTINREGLVLSSQPSTGEVIIEQAPDLISLPIVEALPKPILGNESHAVEPISEPSQGNILESSDSIESEVLSKTSESLVKEPEVLSETSGDIGTEEGEEEDEEEDEDEDEEDDN